MQLQEIYDLAIQMGIKEDPRGEMAVKELLKKINKEYKELTEKKKKFFDTESLKHPYSDSRIYYGNPKKEIKKIIAGIDADGAEVLLVDRLNQKGSNIDAIITHHPHGHGLSGLHEVHEILTDIYASMGVPENIADALISERSLQLKRRLGGPNVYQVVDIARILNIAFMSLHTTWDNQTYGFLKSYIAEKKYSKVGDLLEHIQEIPEFVSSRNSKVMPQIVSGSENGRIGKIVVECTGGTNPSKDVYAELARAGVGTMVQMHIPEDAIKEMQKYHLNAIDIGHIAADSIGANLFLDELERRGIDVMIFGGLVRVKRNK